MPEQRRQDPADTQMFRAFVERNEQEPGRPTRTVLIAVAAVLIAVAAVVAVILAA
jgi:hypothetical protein